MISNKKILGAAMAGACVLAMISACKKKPATSVATAQNATAAQPAVAPAPVVSPVAITSQKQLRKDIDAMPELIEASTPAAKKINAAMKKSDAEALSELKDCKDYSRSMSPTMLGPEYLSVWMNESWDCGAHPNVSLSVTIFDLSTGATVDWSKLVNSPGVKNDGNSDTVTSLGQPMALIDPALFAAYMKWDATQDGFADCKDAFQDVQSFMIWPEAKSGTLVVEPAGLPHVVQACANDMTLTLDQAKALGFNQSFLDAVAAAHKQPGYDKLASPGN